MYSTGLVGDIVSALLDAKARLTGSRARGDEHFASDYDFYVPERAWRRFVREAPEGWESCITGHVAWHTEVGLIEASTIFRNQRGQRLPEATALGTTWRTW